MMSDSGPPNELGVIDRPEVFRPLDELRARIRQPAAGARSGRYERSSMLGRGGMGEVWATRDLHLEREVALKRMRGSEVEGGGDTLPNQRNEAKLARFLREAQLTGSLEHPNIVPVYDLGLDDSGGLFFTMKRMRGHSLAELIERNATGSLMQRLDVFRKICDAIAFAHAHGVIHRDLKPDNVMIGEFGEVIVLDWGLAKRLDEASPVDEADRHSSMPADARSSSGSRSSSLTVAGSVIGTPAFMAPEQALGKLDELDARTDIYALGALLYTLLTGRRPFEGINADLVLEAVVAGDFEPPSRRCKLAREIDAIVCTAMALDPAARYRSVEALRADVQAFLEGHPVTVLHYGWVRRLGKWAARNRRSLTGVGLTAALGLAGLMVGGLVYLRDVEAERARVTAALELAEEARVLAEAARGRAELAEREAAIRAADAEVGLAHSLAQQGDLLTALDKLDTASAGYEQAGASSIRAALARALMHGQNPGPVFRAVLPPGAQLDALAPEGRAFAWHVGERVVVLDWVRGERLIDREVAGLVDAPIVAHAIVASGDEFIVARRSDDRFELLALRSDSVLGSVPASDVTGLLLGNDGRHVLLQTRDGRVQAWDALAGAAIGPSFACGSSPRVSDDVARVLCRPEALAQFSGTALHTIWDTRSGLALGSIEGSTTINLSPSGDAVVFSREHQGLRLVGVDGRQRWYLGDHGIGGSAVFSDEGRRIVSSGIDSIHWLSAEGQVLGSRLGRGTLIDIDAAGSLMLVASAGQAEIWASGPGAHAPTMPADVVLRDFDLAPDELLAVAVTSTGVLVHDPLSGKPLVELELGQRPRAALFDAGGRMAVAAHAEATGERSLVAIYELARADEPTLQISVEQPIMDLAFARGDREVLVALLGGELLRWDLATDQIVGRFDIGQTPWQLQVSPDGELVYIAGRDDARPEVEVWTIADQRRAFATPTIGPAYSVALSPAGDRFTVGPHGGQARTWSLGSLAPLAEYGELGLPIMHLAYGPDAALLYVGSYDGKGHLFDTRDASELLLLPIGVAAPVMSREGHTLIGCGSRFVLDLAERERRLELDLAGTSDAAARALQLVDALVMQGDWDNAARALDWASEAGAARPDVLAGRIAWARGDVMAAADSFGRAQGGDPSLAIWERLTARARSRASENDPE